MSRWVKLPLSSDWDTTDAVQVVKRRVEKITATAGERGGAQRESAGATKRKGVIAAEDSDEEDDRATKKWKHTDDTWKTKGEGGRSEKGDRGKKRGKGEKAGEPGKEDKASEEDTGGPAEKRGLEKMGSHLGSLIGRKRKMRKGGK